MIMDKYRPLPPRQEKRAVHAGFLSSGFSFGVIASDLFMKVAVNYFLISLMAFKTDSGVMGIFLTLAPVA